MVLWFVVNFSTVVEQLINNSSQAKKKKVLFVCRGCAYVCLSCVKFIFFCLLVCSSCFILVYLFYLYAIFLERKKAWCWKSEEVRRIYEMEGKLNRFNCIKNNFIFN